MPRTSVGSVEGLIKILSGEVLPLYPKLREKNWFVELERYIQELHLYLRRQNGKFTAQNLINTINTGGGIGFQRVVEKRLRYIANANENVYVTIDDGFDWRTTTILYSIRTDTDLYSTNLINVPPSDGQTNLIYLGELQGNYPKDFQVGPNRTVLRVTASGALQIGYLNTVGVLDLEFYVYVAAFGSVTNTMSTIRFGNAS